MSSKVSENCPKSLQKQVFTFFDTFCLFGQCFHLLTLSSQCPLNPVQSMPVTNLAIITTAPGALLCSTPITRQHCHYIHPHPSGSQGSALKMPARGSPSATRPYLPCKPCLLVLTPSIRSQEPLNWPKFHHSLA